MYVTSQCSRLNGRYHITLDKCSRRSYHILASARERRCLRWWKPMARCFGFAPRIEWLLLFSVAPRICWWSVPLFLEPMGAHCRQRLYWWADILFEKTIKMPHSITAILNAGGNIACAMRKQHINIAVKALFLYVNDATIYAIPSRFVLHQWSILMTRFVKIRLER